MARTTPRRPVDVTAHFPELAPLARTTVRLHPRPGTPTAADSSIGGPLLWPAREPWPTCSNHAGPEDFWITLDDALLRRRILTEAWNRPRDPGADLLTAAERAVIDRINATQVAPDGPVPMLAVAQLYAADIPDLPRPDGGDLLQVLWCPFNHDEDYLPRTVLRWRAAADVGDPLGAALRPAVIGSDDYLPEPCVLHPETVTEYPAPHELPRDLAARIEAWEHDHGLIYQYDLGVAPGCKVGGYAPWSFSDPFPMRCGACGAGVRPLLTIEGCEWDSGSASWRPVEDAGLDDRRGFRDPACPTMLNIGRGYSMQLYSCAASYAHLHLQNMQ
jgi:hypothetical protein